jgi:hypothetical protein
MRLQILSVLLFCVPAISSAQKWEFGVDGGAGLLNHVTATATTGSATAGFAPGFVAGVFAGENLYKHLSGEIHYEYMQSDLRLSSGGQSPQFSGMAHAVHFDLVYRTGKKNSPVQFFAVVGGGIKDFVATGKEAAYQPLSQYGYFTKTSAVKPLLTGGAGVTFALGGKFQLRAEVRDYLTAFPTAVLTPPPGVKYGNPLNEIVPMVSLVYTR